MDETMHDAPGVGACGCASTHDKEAEDASTSLDRRFPAPVMSATADASTLPDLGRFTIGFDQRDRARFHELIDEVIDSGRWAEGPVNQRFEAAWEAWNGLPSLALSSWAGGALAALEFAGVRGETVLCPSNTFMATPLAALHAGAHVEFVDCNREDLCMSFADFEAKAEQHKPRAALLVHIGGHIAFDAEKIAAYCREHGIFLIEDCAHAHGASWNGQRPGTWGDAGVYSLYATKTISTGEGGVLVSRHPELLEFTRKFRNYGKPEHATEGVNFRMNEFTAALGLLQIERLEEIVAWKNEAARVHLDPVHPARLELPDGMRSGLYKYIVFDWLERSTGRVYDQPCHRILGHSVELPNSDWVAQNHSCVPLYYQSRAAGPVAPTEVRA
jgi:perosamine synthetase